MSAYPPIGKVKTIVLPISVEDDEMSIDEYKEKYGIDLRDIISLGDSHDPHSIHFNYEKTKNAQILILDHSEFFIDSSSQYILSPILRTEYALYDSGNDDGVFTIVGMQDGGGMEAGIYFRIYKGEAFSIENLKISDRNL